MLRGLFATRMQCLLMETLAVCVMARFVSSYPTGAPTAACHDMTPDHYVPPQNTTNPYQLTAINNGDGSFSVTIGKTDSSVPDFKGFLIQVHDQNSTVPVGTFSGYPAEGQQLSCHEVGDSATHTSNIFKTSITLTWNQPPGDVLGFRFVATVVQSQIVFWLDLKSLDLGTILP